MNSRPGSLIVAVVCYAISILTSAYVQYFRLTVKDDVILELAKAGALAEWREKNKPGGIPRFFQETEAEYKERLELTVQFKREELLKKTRDELKSDAMKGLAIMGALILVAAGFFARLNAVRILAIVISVLLALAAGVNLPKAMDNMKKIEHPLMKMDVITFATLLATQAIAFFMLLMPSCRAWFKKPRPAPPAAPLPPGPAV
jgi:hypothetical protein